MRKVLVTGAGGFVGWNCLSALAGKNYQVHATDLAPCPGVEPDVTWHEVDLLDGEQTADLLAEVRPSDLLHMAWYAVPGRFYTAPENLRWVMASLVLLQEFLRHGGTRLVAAGTCAEYGGGAGVCREDDTPLRPATLYGAAKHALHTVAAAYAEQVGLALAWARIFSLYGPRENPNRFVPTMIRALLTGERAVCRHGDYVRDYLHVTDVAGALVALLDSPVTGPVNIASGSARPIGELVRLIARQTGRQDHVEIREDPPGAQDPIHLEADVTRLDREVGWKPRFDLKSGLQETIQWWRNHLANKTP